MRWSALAHLATVLYNGVMKNIREAVHDVIEQRVLPWVERDGISNLILPEQITPDDCISLERCKRLGSGGHREHELAIGLTGKAPYCITQKAFVFTPGRMVFLPAGTYHTTATEHQWQTREINLNRPSSILWLTVYPFGARVQVSHIVSKTDTEESTQPYMLLDRHISRQMGCLLEELRAGAPHHGLVGRCILMEIMHRCLRATAATLAVDGMDTASTMYRRKSGGSKRGRLGRVPKGRRPTFPAAKTRSKKGGPVGPAYKTSAKGEPPGRVQAAQDFIHANYNTTIDLDDIAEAAETSETHLRRQFKAATGMTPIQYLMDVRIAAARELLLTDIKVSEVARLVGIENPYYFSRLFRRINGVSPLQYRRQIDKSIGHMSLRDSEK